MKIQYASDLHLEFELNSRYLTVNPLLPKGDILVLAGDICYLNKYKQHDRFWDYCSRNWKNTYWLPGNHEYYGGAKLEQSGHSYKKNLRDNVEVINNAFVQHENTEIFFTTLWTKLYPPDIGRIILGLNDFHKIKYKGELITYQIYEYFHKSCLGYLEKWLEENEADTRIIVSHHVPSEYCNPKEFRGSVLNSAFIVDLTRLIESYNLDAWVYGHHHRNLPEVDIEGCRLVTNQLGYLAYNEDKLFRRDAYIEIHECEHDWEHIDQHRIQCGLCDEIKYVT